MTLFWLTTALLVAIAMLFIAWPLLKKWGQTRLISARDKGLGLLAIVIPLSAYLFYVVWGNVDELKLSHAIERSVMSASEQERQVAHLEVISILEYQTQKHPNNFKSWYLLGDFYIQTKNFKKAADAFGKAVSLQPSDADALAQYAQALYFAGNHKLTFAITSTTEQALKINPNQPTALGLMGITAFENKRYQEAISYWQKIVWMEGEQNTGAQAAQKGIELARSLLKKQNQWAFVDVRVSIDPSVVVTSSQWVWIFARQPHDTEPVAVVKIKASDLPKRITLDDSVIVPGGVLLSSLNAVEVVATLSEPTSTAPSTSGKQAISEVISPSVKGAHIELLIK